MENRSNVWRLCRDIATGMRIPSFFYHYTHIRMLCHAHIRQLIHLFLQVQLGATLCLMATAHLERTRSNYTARVMCLPTAF